MEKWRTSVNFLSTKDICSKHAHLKPMPHCLNVSNFVKVRVKENGGTEGFWVKVTEIDGDKIKGIVDNELAIVTSTKYKEFISFKREHIFEVLV